MFNPQHKLHEENSPELTLIYKPAALQLFTRPFYTTPTFLHLLIPALPFSRSFIIPLLVLLPHSASPLLFSSSHPPQSWAVS